MWRRRGKNQRVFFSSRPEKFDNGTLQTNLKGNVLMRETQRIRINSIASFLKLEGLKGWIPGIVALRPGCSLCPTCIVNISRHLQSADIERFRSSLNRYRHPAWSISIIARSSFKREIADRESRSRRETTCRQVPFLRTERSEDRPLANSDRGNPVLAHVLGETRRNSERPVLISALWNRFKLTQSTAPEARLIEILG